MRTFDPGGDPLEAFYHHIFTTDTTIISLIEELGFGDKLTWIDSKVGFYKDGKLWLATPPSRMIYHIDPETWMVEHQFPSVHKRPHGIGFEGDYLWESDADVATFYKRDPESGVVIDAIRLSDDDPIPHGASVWDGYIWWVDDVVGNSWVSRMPI